MQNRGVSVTMRCPYCNKKNFIPEVVITYTENYGGGIVNFRCLHCEKVVNAGTTRVVRINYCKKTENESDW